MKTGKDNQTLGNVSVDPLNNRIRRSPFWECSVKAGRKSYHLYNRMLLANTDENDYFHLKSGVQLWDTGAERQVEIKGPDAHRLVQSSTPRDLSEMRDDQCFLIPTVDQNGYMTNDPVLTKVAQNHYWLSVSDADLILFYKGVAAAKKMNVSIEEPQVSPLGIQGAKADELAVKVWGEQVLDIKFFRYKRVDVFGKPMILARSGFSSQGGYELYFEGTSGAEEIWEKLMNAGKDMDIKAGCPTQFDRIESGLLAYRIDITSDMTPFEAGLGRWCQMEKDFGCLAWSSLREKCNPSRQIRPIEILGDPLPRMQGPWTLKNCKGINVGRISSSCRALGYNCNAGIGLVDSDHWNPGTDLIVETQNGSRQAIVKSKFWARK
jgi:dimethylsulfoniopropionate demethylase